MAVPIYIPTSSTQEFSFLHILTSLFTFWLSGDKHPHRCQAFIFEFTWLVTLSTFSSTCWPFIYLFLKKMSIQILCPVLNWVIWVCFVFSVELCGFCIFWILNPCQMCGWQIFSPIPQVALWWLFPLLHRRIFVVVPLNFCFCCLCFSVKSKKNLSQDQCQGDYPLWFL